MSPAELLRGEPGSHALYERTLSAVMRLPMTAPTDDLGLVIARALVEAAEVGAADPAPQTVKVVYEPPAGSVGVDVEDLAKGGVKLTVSVRKPREDGETWDDTTLAAVRTARVAYESARINFPKEEA